MVEIILRVSLPLLFVIFFVHCLIKLDGPSIEELQMEQRYIRTMRELLEQAQYYHSIGDFEKEEEYERLYSELKDFYYKEF